jgi:hypothetical protein
MAALRAEILAGDRPAVLARVTAKAGETPGIRWLVNRAKSAVPRPVRRSDGGAGAGAVDTDEWRQQEREALQEEVKDPHQPAWVWHGAIARALQVGDLGLAQRAEQRLHAVAPEERLWSLQLKQLDLTEQAFRELVRTRADGNGVSRINGRRNRHCGMRHRRRSKLPEPACAPKPQPVAVTPPTTTSVLVNVDSGNASPGGAVVSPLFVSHFVHFVTSLRGLFSTFRAPRGPFADSIRPSKARFSRFFSTDGPRAVHRG